MTKKLHTTDEEFDGMHQALNKARSTTTKITVDRKAVAHLLMDHAAMLDRLDRLEIE